MDKQFLIETMLRSDVDFQCKCLEILYQRQTMDEKAAEHSIHKNMKGFNSPDAMILSGIAEALRRGDSLHPIDKTYLSDLLPKYAKQLKELVSDQDLNSE